MEFIWAIWEIIVNIIECYFLFYLFEKQLKFRQIKRKYILIILICLISIVSIMNLSGVNYKITMVVVFALKIFFSLLFGSNIVKRLFWGCVGAFVAIIGNSLISVIVIWLSNININDTLLPGDSRFGITLLYCIIIIFIYLLLSRFNKQKGFSLPKKYQISFIGILLLALLAIAEAISFAIQLETFQERFVLTIISAAILIMSISIVFLFDKIGNTIYEKLRAETQLKQTHLEEENNRRIEGIVKAWRHDFHNYLEVLQILVKNRDYEQLEKYLGETKQDFRYAISLIATENSAIDAIISSKLLIAYNSNIEVSLDIKPLPVLPISETKLCVLLGNLLDNAIEACQKISIPRERYINIDIFPKRGMLFIHIKNCTLNDYHWSDNKLISSKTLANHGYGLERVIQIVQEANGIYQLDPSTDTFAVTIFLPMQKEQS